ncbi:MAG: hypothetical protein H6574_21040 [Lewinellaceae bacterium]|nr:hypothetical protein [Saprospiraceae bacterium]MCB9333554.1 hypothetical protein [Lewinellaceae bacterium]
MACKITWNTVLKFIVKNMRLFVARILPGASAPGIRRPDTGFPENSFNL